MYRLKINIIGCDEQDFPPAAREILKRWAIIDDDYPTATAFQKNVLMKEDEDRLLIFHINSAFNVPELKRLNSTYPRYPILAVVDATSDPTLVVKSMRAGALQVVNPPVAPDDLREALDCIAAKHAGLSTLAKVVAVTGAVGGCGGTTVAINLAYELARQSKARCVLMELALRKGTLANNLDIAPQYTTSKLVAEIDRIDSYILQAALTEIAENFSVLVGPYDTIQAEDVDLESAMRLIHLTRHMADWLILDVPTTYDELFFHSLMSADQIVLVVDQTVATIRGAQMVIDALGQRYPLIVINRYNPKLIGLTVDKIQEFMPNCEVFGLANDPAVGESMDSGKPLRLYSQCSPFLTDLDALLPKLDSGVQKQRTSGMSESILKRLGRALSLS